MSHRPITFNRSSKIYDLQNLTEVEIFQLVLKGKLKRFPMHFWSCQESDEYAPVIIRYMTEKLIGIQPEDIPQKIRKYHFTEYKLSRMIDYKYQSSPYIAMTAAYPYMNFKAWDFTCAPNNYWRGENGQENAFQAMRWLFEKKLQWSREDILAHLNQAVFIENNLLGMLKHAYGSSMYDAIEALYPGEFQPWEVGVHVPNSYWTIETGKQAVRWLIEKRLKWSEEEVKRNINRNVFREHNLYGMLQSCFDSSPTKAVMESYPGDYGDWEFRLVPWAHWRRERVARLMKWLHEMYSERLLSEESFLDLMEELGYGWVGRHFGLKRMNRIFKEMNP